MKFLIQTLGILVAVWFLLPLESAIAADGKSYPGSICQYWTAPLTDGNAKRNKLQVSQFGWVGNHPSANNRIGIVCPLVRDSMRGGIERIMVRGFDPDCPPSSGRNCPGNNECTLRIMPGLEGTPRREIGPQEMARWNDASSGSNATLLAGFTNISIPDFTNAEDPSQGSTIVLFCRIEPGVRINFIYVGEES
jgi:hypothetical protein